MTCPSAPRVPHANPGLLTRHRTTHLRIPPRISEGAGGSGDRDRVHLLHHPREPELPTSGPSADREPPRGQGEASSHFLPCDPHSLTPCTRRQRDGGDAT